VTPRQSATISDTQLIVSLHLPERLGRKFQSVNQGLAFGITTEYQLNSASVLGASHFRAAKVGKNDHSTTSLSSVTSSWAVCSNCRTQKVATIELKRNRLDLVIIDFISTVLQVAPPLLDKVSA
jgi:hypothetical protein